MSLVPQPDYWKYEGTRRVGRWLPKPAVQESHTPWLHEAAPPPSVTAQPEPYVQPPDSGVSVRAATDALQAAPDIAKFTEVFDHTVDEGHGAFAQAHLFLESAANWCRDCGALDSADQLDSWAHRLEELIDDVRVLPESLAVESGWRYLDERRAQVALRPSPTTPTAKPTAAQPNSARVVPTAAPAAVRHR
ncbi:MULTISPECIES: hypothetical protein [unclassified Streptomyces]|uniref:hypothetical protein n=1 Tax=unclassified Streptomyces TaxID=2593676 RepID=UPI000A8993F8|nr:hypothetical protein [Streptomyces sp. TSRI0281]